jgi:hypothetical protein
MRAIAYWSDETGATTVEHAIVVCVMALVIACAVGSGLTPGGASRRIDMLCVHERARARTNGSRAMHPGLIRSSLSQIASEKPVHLISGHFRPLAKPLG